VLSRYRYRIAARASAYGALLLGALLLLAACGKDHERGPTTFYDALPAPTDLQADPAGTTGTVLDVQWDMDPASVPLVDHYNVYNMDPQFGVLFLVGTSLTTAFQDTGLVPNFPLLYVVSAVDQSDFEGFRSVPLLATP
jgi:hypothetical protein